MPQLVDQTATQIPARATKTKTIPARRTSARPTRDRNRRRQSASHSKAGPIYCCTVDAASRIFTESARIKPGLLDYDGQANTAAAALCLDASRNLIQVLPVARFEHPDVFDAQAITRGAVLQDANHVVLVAANSKNPSWFEHWMKINARALSLCLRAVGIKFQDFIVVRDGRPASILRASGLQPG